MNTGIAHRTFVLGGLLVGWFATLAIGQDGKKPVTMRDVSLWRTHSVGLSNDGKWYWVRYRLATTDKITAAAAPKIDKPVGSEGGVSTTDNANPQQKSRQSKATQNKKKTVAAQKEQQQIALYGKDALTDVIYIRQANGTKEYQVKRGVRPVFSDDSKWIATSISAEEEPSSTKKDQDKKPQSKPVTIQLLNLKTGARKQWEIISPSSTPVFQFPTDTHFFVIYSKSGLTLFDLQNETEHYIGNVGEVRFRKKKDVLIYTVKTEDRNGNGIYSWNKKTGVTRTLVSGNARFSSLSLNEDNSALAAFQVHPSPNKKTSDDVKLVVISELDSNRPTVATHRVDDWEGMPAKMNVAVQAGGASGLQWSKDSRRLLVRIKKQEDVEPGKKSESDDLADKTPKPEVTQNNSKIVANATVDVWHWKDESLQSQQMLENRTKRETIYDAVLHLATKKLIQLTDDDLRIQEKSEDGRWAIGVNGKPYVSDWDVSRADIYRIDLTTGQRRLIVKGYVGRMELFPDGKQALYWRDGHYWIYSLENDTHRNITNSTPVSFINTRHDYYGSQPAFGFAGVVRGGKSIILRHLHDLWLQPLDGAPGTCLTLGMGEEKQIRFDLGLPPRRRARELEMDQRYVDLSAPLLLRGFNTKTKASGYFLLRDGKIEPQLYEPQDIGPLNKAKQADVVIYTRGDYQQFPETYLSTLDFKTSKRLTRTNPQQTSFKWGERILIDYTNRDGVELQGILSIPEGYQEGMRLPMIVYAYEKLSDRLHRYPTPRIAGSGTSEMFYVSDGYLFLQPDIHFRKRTSHSDMHECIDAAIQKVVELGYADEKRIGFIGHSFGGHAAMYISTQNNRFAAIIGGAGVSNLIQGFNVDIVRDGSNEQDYYITGQGRLTASPADDLGLYIDQSPVFHAKNMNTPLLLYHGTADNVVLWEHSFGFYNLLRYLKKPVIMLSYRGEGHGIRDFENRKDLQLRVRAFFDHHLKGEPAAEWIREGVSFDNRPESDGKKSKRSVLPWK